MIFTIEQITDIVKPIAEKYELKAVYVFGSYARDEAHEESDIDLYIDDSNSILKSAFDIGGLFYELEEAFEKPIDVVTIRELNDPENILRNPFFGEKVEKEKRLIYAKRE